MEFDYLEHHGILGQKWGVRRFRKPNGGLTAAGKKRQAQLEAEKKFLTNKTKSDTKTSVGTAGKSGSASGLSSNKKSINNLSTEELQKVVSRLNLENRYNELTKDKSDPNRQLRLAKERLELERDYKKVYNELHPKKESIAKKFLNQIGDAAVKEASNVFANQGKAIVNKILTNTIADISGNDKKKK